MTHSNNFRAGANVDFARQALSDQVFGQQDTSSLPSGLQGLVRQFYGHLGNARNAFESMPQQVENILSNIQYPAEYRQVQAQEAKEQAFTRVDQELKAAAEKLAAARQQVKQALTPPLLGSPDLHELKMMNAREEVKMALEGRQPGEQVQALVELFQEAYEADAASPIAFFIGATDAYKRLLRDPLTQLVFASEQQGMLRRLLPPVAACGSLLLPGCGNS